MTGPAKQTTEDSQEPPLASSPAARRKARPFDKRRHVRRYLATGDHDDGFPGWPGRNFIEAATNGSACLREALIAEVRARTSKTVGLAASIAANTHALTRAKVEPMVRGLFTQADHAPVLAALERSVVVLTPDSIESVLRRERWLHTAWMLANLYLGSIGVERLSRKAPNIVGLSQETTCYVSPASFEQSDPFADFIVHEAAHVFHNCKRGTLGLRETRNREWLLDIDFGRRETFAYACEAYSCIVRAGGISQRNEALARHADGSLPNDETVEHDEYLDILAEAVQARNGWKRILERCAPQRLRYTPLPNSTR